MGVHDRKELNRPYLEFTLDPDKEPFPVVAYRTDGENHPSFTVMSDGSIRSGSGLVVPENDFDFFRGTRLVDGEENFPRELAQGAVGTVSSGSVHGSLFTARKTETINSLVFTTSGTAAAATPTLCKVGVYSWNDDTDSGSLLASSANDTSLFAAIYTQYTIPLTSTWQKQRGRRYALAFLVVTSVAMPNFVGIGVLASGTLGTINSLKPRRTTMTTGQTDLPATLTGTSAGGGSNQPFIRMLP